MATSGTTAFAPDFTEIAEEAWEQAGKEMRSGWQLRTARTSMNLLTIEWASRGINLWTVEEGQVSLVSGTQNYSLPADTIDLLEQVIRTGSGTSQSDIHIERISPVNWATLSNKNVTGRPNQVWVDRQLTPEINVWPVPNSNDYTFVYWRLRRVEDAGRGAETPDIPFRWYPALIAGLAVKLAKKTPELEPRVARLSMDYEQAFNHAAEEDRVKTPMRLVPRMSRG